MEPWFTVQKIDDSTFAISEYRHWEETHCYLLCGTDRAVLIDTGLGVSNRKRVAEELTEHSILVVTTHAHWDHIGGHKWFAHVAVHESEREWLSGNFPVPLQVVKDNLMKKPCVFPADFMLENYEIYQGSAQWALHDGDCLELGGRKLQVIHTPGHSPGHCCFYEPDRKYLYSGDLIYKGCLDAFYPTTDPLMFWRSVQKIQGYKVNHIFPGHHSLEIPVSMINDVEAGFSRLQNRGKLCHGSGIFDFGDFAIHI